MRGKQIIEAARQFLFQPLITGIHRAHGGWRILGHQHHDLAHGAPLLQHRLATLQIVQPATGLVPPCVGSLEVDAIRPHRHARFPVEPWLVRVAVENKLVDPAGIHQVACGLEGLGAFGPAVEVRGERLRRNQRLTGHLGARAGMFGQPVMFGQIGHIVCPELPHRHIHFFCNIQRVAEHRVIVFRPELQAVFVTEFGVICIVVFEHQFLQRPAIIFQKPFGGFHIVHHAAGEQQRQERCQVIAAPRAEFLRHRRSPVLRAHFPTVGGRVGKRLASERSAEFCQASNESIIVPLDRCLAELVAFQRGDAGRRGNGFHSACRVTHPQDCPPAGRNLPSQLSGYIHVFGQVHDLARWNHRPIRATGPRFIVKTGARREIAGLRQDRIQRRCQRQIDFAQLISIPACLIELQTEKSPGGGWKCHLRLPALVMNP